MQQRPPIVFHFGGHGMVMERLLLVGIEPHHVAEVKGPRDAALAACGAIARDSEPGGSAGARRSSADITDACQIGVYAILARMRPSKTRTASPLNGVPW